MGDIQCYVEQLSAELCFSFRSEFFHTPSPCHPVDSHHTPTKQRGVTALRGLAAQPEAAPFLAGLTGGGLCGGHGIADPSSSTHVQQVSLARFVQPGEQPTAKKGLRKLFLPSVVSDVSGRCMANADSATSQNNTTACKQPTSVKICDVNDAA
eukprot:gene12866-biopygen4539